MNAFDLKGRVSIVTGALGLIGREHCLALAEHGARVVAADLDPNRCEAFARELADKTGAEVIGLGVDITKAESIRAMCERIEVAFGPPDVLVNNAAINDMFENPQAAAEQSKFENYPLELWQRSLDVNLTGVFLCCQVIGSAMASRGRGSIINIASTYGIVAPDQNLYKAPDGSQNFYKSVSYPVTKAGVIQMTRFLASYWGRAGVRVNTLSPGGVENGQQEYFVEQYSKRTPLGRMAAPSDYHGAIVFLASDASAYMTGANLVVDGGWTAW